MGCGRHPEQNHGRRILVVEDDKTIALFLERLLLECGYWVLPAHNGVEALVALTAPEVELPHAVILDLGLPLESGSSVLAFVRTVMRSGLPVVVMTGNDNPEEEAAVRALGISAFLRKPVGADQMLHAIAAALG